jgi:transposase
MLNMYQQVTIKTLDTQGSKHTDIANKLNCHRNTVRNILKRKEIIEKQTRLRPQYFDVHKDKIKELLDKKVTKLRIYEILKENYQIEKSYDMMCKYVQKAFPPVRETFVVQQVSPGEVVEVDFGYAGILPGKDGSCVKQWVLVMTFGYSRQGFYDTVEDLKVSSFCSAIEKGFQFFEGVPKYLKIDNLKAGVIHNRRYDLEFNKDFLAFANYYGFLIQPCPPFKPNQKGKVESGVNYVCQNFFSQRTFESNKDLKDRLHSWIIHTANSRIHGTTKQIPYEMFELEKHYLQPLKPEPFPVFDTYRRKVKTNCHVNFNNNYYSVPSSYVGTEVTIRAINSLVRISDAATEIATHALSNKTGEYVTNPNHFPQYKIYSQTQYQANNEAKMKNIGENTHALFVSLLNTNMLYPTVRRILGLVETYGKDDVEKSIARALHFGASSFDIIKNICVKKLFNLDTEMPLIKVLDLHEDSHEVNNTIGGDNYE